MTPAVAFNCLKSGSIIGGLCDVGSSTYPANDDKDGSPGQSNKPQRYLDGDKVSREPRLVCQTMTVPDLGHLPDGLKGLEASNFRPKAETTCLARVAPSLMVSAECRHRPYCKQLYTGDALVRSSTGF